MLNKDIGQTQNAEYQPPAGLVSYPPASCLPYAELMRLDRPAGFYALYVPCLFGVFYAAIASFIQASLGMGIDRTVTLLFFCLLARGAACTWNDTVYRDFDKKVARCRVRLIARGDVSLSQAYVWAIVQTLAIIGIDVADDVHAGVKSMAVKFQDSTKLLTSLLACVMTALLAMTGIRILVKLGPMYYVSAVGESAASLAATISMVNLADSRSCGWWFS
ncbi:UbiA prenyltransferase family-domain-containing protein [Penicillium daleae]|uniref:UbiA prenyltransferase family-domain-containing protein n=1 Tax=Penicillium daleae TaxID=63821 RepID=A0AAD6CAX8_9EURO|nr:UbiA prenyltransferase family-domain-containing protein [Penicillium daleae]KAJ5454627.1 UbiA prenyltransferase family-domain-containing protein [Penicillium daleae]